MSHRVVFNLNGTKFEMSKSTFTKLTESGHVELPEVELMNTKTEEYFLERHASCFSAVLDYLHSGVLHMPPNVCPNTFKRELNFWHIDAQVMSRCCYRMYLAFFEDESVLQKFGEDIKRGRVNGLRKHLGRRARLWAILDDPSSSMGAKVYLGVSTLFVLVSIFVLAASTHPLFQRSLDAEEWNDVLGHDKYEDFKYRLPHRRPLGPRPPRPEDFPRRRPPSPPASQDTNSNGQQLPPNGSSSQPSPPPSQLARNRRPPNRRLISRPGSNPNPPPGTSPQADLTSSTQSVTNPPDENSSTADNATSSDNSTLQLDLTSIHAMSDYLLYMEYATIIFFTVEFLTRIVCSPDKYLFCRNFLNVIELIALLAMYTTIIAEYFVPAEKYKASVLDLVESLQMIRVLRVFRIVKDVTGFRVLLYSLESSVKEILLLSLYLSIATVLYASLVYFLERDNMRSIPDAAWWVVITMTTVGYGDMVPVSFQGKLVGCLCAMSGVILIAVTVPIFVSNFLLFYTYSKVADHVNMSSEDHGRPEKSGGGPDGPKHTKTRSTPRPDDVQRKRFYQREAFAISTFHR